MGQGVPMLKLKRVLPPLILIGLMLIVFYGLSPTVRPIPARDASVYLYSGREILKGALPYRDLWDHRPPGLFYLNAVGLALGSGSVWGVWALELAFLCGPAVLSYALLKRLFGAKAAFLATLLWIIVLPLLYDFDIAEEFTLLFQFIALACFIRAEERGSYRWYGFAIGASLAVSINLRQNLIGVWVAIALFLLLRAFLTGRIQATIRDLLWIGAGAITIFVPILAYFGAQGLLGEMWNAAYVYNFLYANAAWSYRLDALGMGALLLTQSGIFVAALGGWLVGLYRLWRRSGTIASVIALALIALPVELLMSSFSGRRYAHYFISTLPILSLLSALLLNQLFVTFEKFQPSRRASASALVIAAILVACYLPLQAYSGLGGGVTYTPAGTRGLTSQYVEQHTRPDDYVLVWGAEAMVNFIADRRTPSRYINNYTLFMPGFESAALIQEYVADLQRWPPAYIIDTAYGNGLFSPIDPKGRRDWIQAKAHDTSTVADHADFQPLPAMDLFFNYVYQNYHSIGSIRTWIVYQRNDFQPPGQ